MNDIGTDLCIDQFEGYVGLDYNSSELAVFSIYPTEGSWADGDREIDLCSLRRRPRQTDRLDARRCPLTAGRLRISLGIKASLDPAGALRRL